MRLFTRLVDVIVHPLRVLSIVIRGGSVGKKVKFIGQPILSMKRGSRLTISDGVVLCSRSDATALGVNHPVIIRTLVPSATIAIGVDTGISGATICSAISVKIGSRCLIGANVTIADTDFHPMRVTGRRYEKNFEKIASIPVTISDDVFIGTGSIILKGVHVGRGAVVGAGSIVTRSVPPLSIVAGNPARVVGTVQE